MDNFDTVTNKQGNDFNYFLSFEEKVDLAIGRLRVAQAVNAETTDRREAASYLKQAETLSKAARDNAPIMVVLVNG